MIFILRPPQSVGSIAKQLNQSVQDEQSNEIQITSLTAFEWDLMYLFDHTVLRKDICEMFIDCENEILFHLGGERASERISIVFTLDENVVHSEVLKKSDLDIVVEQPISIYDNHDVFSVTYENTTPIIILD